MGKELKILMIEDVPADAELEIRDLKKAGIECVTCRVENEVAFRKELREFLPDLILSDFTLPAFDGMTALEIARELCPETPFIFVSGTIGEDRAIEALKRGATDYVLKTNLKRLVPAVRRALREKEDRAERKLQGQKIARLSRIHAVLSGINSAIVRIHDRKELFREACRVAVEHGKFGMAWIGLLDRDTMKVEPMGWYGFEEELLRRISLCARSDAPQGRGTAGRALREKKPFFCNEIGAEPRVGVIRDEAVSRGYHSVISLPLLVNDAAAGVLILYAKEPGFFDEEELKLLEELAGDISFALEYIEKQEKLDYLAYYNALTGLPNRSLCHDRLKQLLNAAARDRTRAALIMVDLERFRIINDTLGRHAGDTLLKRIGERLRNSLNDPDAAAFLGGNAFAVLVPDIKEGAHIARILEDKILTAISEPITVDGQELRVAAKAGVALFPNDGADADTLFMNAEIALRKAKTAGDRYLFYAPQMNLRVAERLTIENKLRRAVEEKQFVLYYQPKVSLDSGHITGLEALIRWNDPDNGVAPPATFIPFLEETGMILEVGRWALEKAASDYKRWETMGLRPPKIAVNVSPLQLRQKTFVDEVKGAIDRAAGGSAALDLEITESLIMEDIESNIEKLKVFREINVVVFIDDFGTGYSSLSYLAKLPLGGLKIDRAFIINLIRSPDDMTIVSTIISLARALNLRVVAEGVETEEQQKLLRLLKCDEMQGYVFSKPLPQEKIEAMLAARTQLRIVSGDRS